MPLLNGLDYAILTVLVVSIIMGVIRGFIKEIIALVAWVAAFMVATKYSVSFAALFINPPTDMPSAKPIDYLPTAAIIISYLSLFVGTLIGGSIVKFIANSVVEKDGLSLINRFLGSIFGLARGAMIIVLMMFFLTYTAIVKQPLWNSSAMVRVFQPALKWVSVAAEPYLSIIAAKMKKTAAQVDQEAMPDVIQLKKTSSSLPAA